LPSRIGGRSIPRGDRTPADTHTKSGLLKEEELVRRWYNELVGPDKPARYWPQNAQKLSDMIKRVSPNLKSMGIEVSRGKEDRNTRFIKFRKLSE
jgi:hypothetical protein